MNEACAESNFDTADGAATCHKEIIECSSQLSDYAKIIGDKFEELYPGMGSYANEGDYTLDTWKEQFWGENYERLLDIKQTYDPDGVFTCHHCIGSDLIPDHQMSSAYSATILLIPLLVLI